MQLETDFSPTIPLKCFMQGFRAVQDGVTHLDVEHPDKVGPLWVVFDQTGHSAAPLHPAAAPVCAVDLDHRRAQSLHTHRTDVTAPSAMNTAHRTGVYI